MDFAQDLDKILNKTLFHYWKYREFREFQKEIILSILQNKDTCALLPTGGGKSLCYQLPALILDGVCLVISPLLALMKDQVSQLKFKNINAEYISSELDDYEMEIIFNKCIEGQIKLLYISPERTKDSNFLKKMKEVHISFIAIDEAHCISEWGQDFRPSYQNIKLFREEYKNVPILALTATATPKVLNDICEKASLQNPNIFKKSFKRENIKIYIDEVSDKLSKIFYLLRENQSTGIIYGRTRKEVENLTYFLKNKGIENIDFYHAGLSTFEKNKRQEKWMNGSREVLVCTNAFGMGIDKSDVRFVIHLSPPNSLENYYQEIGRLGRDGEESYAMMFWNEQELSNFDELLKNQTATKKEFLKNVSFLYSLFQIADFELPEDTFQLNIEKIKKLSNSSLAKIKSILNFLHNQEIIYYNKGKSESILDLKIEIDEIENLSRSDFYLMELLLRSIPGLATCLKTFNEDNIAKKIGTDRRYLRERLIELRDKGYVEYIDGHLDSMRFLKHRDSLSFENKWWFIFDKIQINKIQKWEQMKFFIRNQNLCSMKMILSYFGEKTKENCHHCGICEAKKENVFSAHFDEILNFLKTRPMTLEELSIKIPYLQREKILEELILLRDLGKIEMMNYKTYMING